MTTGTSVKNIFFPVKKDKSGGSKVIAEYSAAAPFFRGGKGEGAKKPPLSILVQKYN